MLRAQKNKMHKLRGTGLGKKLTTSIKILDIYQTVYLYSAM